MQRFADSEPPPHRSVLYHQIILALRPQSQRRYVDATLGAGGHAAGILEASSPDGQLLGIDLDPQALALASQRLAEYSNRVILVQASFTSINDQLARVGWEQVAGIVIDLGVSSMQFDTPERGFSFQADGPLDMRFGPQQAISAEELVNSLPEAELADLIWRYGEDRLSRRIARSILQARPLRTTRELADAVAHAYGGKKERIHPATRTFQALRIAVNQELQALETVLPQAIAALTPGGRLAIISFHSLEDRMVKQYFRRESRNCICPPELPVCTCGHKASITEITRHPIQAGDDEVAENPRSRSAKLRVAEKIDLA